MDRQNISFIIREANESDFSSIISLLKEFALFQKTPDRMKMTVEQLQHDKDLFNCWLAETNDQVIVGYVAFFKAYYSWSGKAFYVDDLYVKTEYRGANIGGQLLEKVIQEAKKEGCKKVKWQVSHWNKNAIEFYKKMGAVVDDTEWNCDLTL